ncbi:hypothetical protein [Streptomyces spiralis]
MTGVPTPGRPSRPAAPTRCTVTLARPAHPARTGEPQWAHPALVA